MAKTDPDGSVAANDPRDPPPASYRAISGELAEVTKNSPRWLQASGPGAAIAMAASCLIPCSAHTLTRLAPRSEIAIRPRPTATATAFCSGETGCPFQSCCRMLSRWLWVGAKYHSHAPQPRASGAG